MLVLDIGVCYSLEFLWRRTYSSILRVNSWLVWRVWWRHATVVPMLAVWRILIVTWRALVAQSLSAVVLSSTILVRGHHWSPTSHLLRWNSHLLLWHSIRRLISQISRCSSHGWSRWISSWNGITLWRIASIWLRSWRLVIHIISTLSATIVIAPAKTTLTRDVTMMIGTSTSLSSSSSKSTFLLVFVALTCVVHLYLSTKNHFALHISHGSLTFFFVGELDKSVAFWNSWNWITYNFCFYNWWIGLLECLQKHWIGYFVVQVSNVHLVFTLVKLGLLLNRLRCMMLRRRCMLYVLVSRIGSRNSTSMRSPVQFENLVASRNGLSVKRLEYLFCGLRISKLDKTITNWGSLAFVPYELDVLDCSNVVKLSSNVLLTHPWLYITNP